MSGLALTVKRAVFRASPELAWRLAARRDAETAFNLALIRALADPERLGLDIGGSWGLTAAAMASRVGELHVFEPVPGKAAFLRRSLDRRARVHEVALSDTDGEIELHIPHASSALSTIEAANAARELPGERVRVRRARLDSLSLGPVGLAKIDVEGHEGAVLAGAEALLLRDRPALLIEIEERHRPGGLRATVGWLEARGYRSYMVASGTLRPAAEFDAARDQSPQALGGGKGAGYVNDFLFLAEGDASGSARLGAAGIALPVLPARV